MSKQVALAATPRAGNGKGEARSLRRQGRVPAIAYGADLSPTTVSVDALELYHALHTEAGDNAILRLDVGGGTHLALAREIQRHPVRRDVLHVDFVTVSRDVKVTVDVPIVLEGAAPGAEEGGVLNQEHYTVSVSVLPLEVPGQIVLDVGDLQLNDVRRFGDLSLPSGVELLSDADATVVSITVPTTEDVGVTEGLEPEATAAAEAEGATAGEAEPAEGMQPEALEEA
jgi:large subunit ribosomal protein L25